MLSAPNYCMLNGGNKYRPYIPLLLLIATAVTAFIQIILSITYREIVPDVFIVEFALLILTLFAFITASKHYNILVDIGLSFIIYALVVHLVEEFLDKFSLNQTILLSGVLFLGLFFMIAGVRITIKEQDKNIIRYRLQKNELNYQLTELTEMSEALDQANKKIRLLISLTRHDLLNQLTIVQGFNAIAIEELENPDPDKIRQYLKKVMHAGERIEAMIQFTKEYEELGVYTSGWHQVVRIIESSRDEAALADVTVENAVPSDLEIYADPIIRKVFTTLLENSIRHGGESMNYIRISSTDAENTLIIRYEDNGPGVPLKEKE
ncbi:MAG: hypothetical protein CVU88_07495, partial [Firmicutes bacterium HGW-Firmicutes-13]